jgi:hypothetical protein
MAAIVDPRGIAPGSGCSPLGAYDSSASSHTGAVLGDDVLPPDEDDAEGVGEAGRGVGL